MKKKKSSKKRVVIISAIITVLVVVAAILVTFFLIQQNTPDPKHCKTLRPNVALETGEIVETGEVIEVCLEDFIGLSVKDAEEKATQNKLLPIKIIPADWHGATDDMAYGIYLTVDSGIVVRASFDRVKWIK